MGRRIIQQGNKRVKRLLPQLSMATISSRGNDKLKDPNSKDEADIEFSDKKHTQTLPLLSRLNSPSRMSLVDVSRLKEFSCCPSGKRSRHELSFPVCFSEATSDCNAECSEDQNRSQHLRQDSDHLLLSLGIRSSNHSFEYDLSGFESAFPAVDTQTPPSEEYDNRFTASKRLKATEAITSQLTISYAGKVQIFQGVPEDKAKAIIHLAENATRIQDSSNISSTIFQQCPSSSVHASPDTALPQTSHDAGRSSASAVLSLKTRNKLQPAGNIPYSALPQHRRLSLQRFLQRRRERISTRPADAASPYIADKNNLETGSLQLLTGIASTASHPAAAAFLGGSACSKSCLGDQRGRSSSALVNMQ